MDQYSAKHLRADRKDTWLGLVPQPVWVGAAFVVALVVTLRLVHTGGGEEEALRATETTAPSCFVFGACPVTTAAVPGADAVAAPTTVAPTTTAPAAAAPFVPVDGQYSVVSRVVQGTDCTANSFRMAVRTSGAEGSRRVTFTVGGRSFGAALSPAYGFAFTAGTSGTQGTDSVSGSFNPRSSPITLQATETIRLNDGRSCRTSWSGRRVG